ncbi:mannose-6-phosphate isomerase [Williamsoniiplasma somnilux]|uniref:Mannose-6-phosphate isomerase n=1 Tax=Williamsoniiplasma somnilux TaxID=215578 RepID=A0A2K8P146_9MOLU|nr:type I phosphomannose isomerase catalytic subunit [Williamsoniiplasma somnilux]ATZ18623.1 mannose-6-phosphate isomerase [Williamsoniiplasma somnilux]
MKIVKLKPFYSEKLWGGSKLKNLGFDIPENKKIGEAWIISAHNNGMTFFEEKDLKGKSLKYVFENNRQWFGNYQGEFPLLVKIITANDYLSVQVHPTDAYALKKHHSLGKPESWLILDCPDDAFLIYGHNAQSLFQLEEMVATQQWDKLLKKVSVNKGDFLYVEPGKVHAITPGVTVCEVQRSSDITYRFYDYDRVDDQGLPRQLDIEDSINCTVIPDTAEQIVHQASGQIFSSEFFSIYIMDATKEKYFQTIENPYFLTFTVIHGSGTINGQRFSLGESAISLGAVENVEFSGDLKVIIAWIRK